MVLLVWYSSGLVLAVEPGGLVKGRVAFHGFLPSEEKRLVKADEDVCGKEVWIQTVQMNETTLGLRSVVVSVKNNPSFRMEAAPSKRIIANANCVFAPRVGAARLGDILEIHNNDPILHNTHIKKGERTFLNIAQVAGSRPIPKILKRTGVHTFRCDKHTFMSGAILVFEHPYFTVTDEFGDFELPALPAGTYTLAIWHETLGSLEQEVTVPSQGSVTVNFDYL